MISERWIHSVHSSRNPQHTTLLAKDILSRPCRWTSLCTSLESTTRSPPWTGTHPCWTHSPADTWSTWRTQAGWTPAQRTTGTSSRTPPACSLIESNLFMISHQFSILAASIQSSLFFRLFLYTHQHPLPHTLLCIERCSEGGRTKTTSICTDRHAGCPLCTETSYSIPVPVHKHTCCTETTDPLHEAVPPISLWPPPQRDTNKRTTVLLECPLSFEACGGRTLLILFPVEAHTVQLGVLLTIYFLDRFLLITHSLFNIHKSLRGYEQDWFLRILFLRIPACCILDMSRLFIHKYKYKYTSSFLIAIN